MPFSLLPVNESDKEAASEALNLHKWLSNSEMRGCGLEGKLFQRVWYLDFECRGEATVLPCKRGHTVN